MKNIFKIGIIGIIFTLYACGNDDSSTTPETTNFQVQNLLRDVTNHHIIVNVTTFLNEATRMEENVDNYLSDLTEVSLETAKSQWKQTAISYGKVYTFNIGLIRDQFTHQALYNWPTVTNAVENFISNPTEVTEAYVQSLSPQAKTLSALEYLLFKTDVTSTHLEFVNSENRRNYLRYVAKELKTRAARLVHTWSTSGDNYSTTFIENTATGIDASFSLLYNGVYNIIDTGKVTKIGKPAGLENSQNTNPEATQAHFSNTSLAILKENIESVEDVYFSTQGLGISNYVAHVADNEVLNTAIRTKINEVYAAIDAIPVPLFDAITSNPTEVETLHEKLNELAILFSVDVRSILSITITSTDNDGD